MLRDICVCKTGTTLATLEMCCIITPAQQGRFKARWHYNSVLMSKGFQGGIILRLSIIRRFVVRRHVENGSDRTLIAYAESSDGENKEDRRFFSGGVAFRVGGAVHRLTGI